jgi:hypothetical protein
MSKYLDNKELFLGATTTQYGNHMVMTNVMKPGKTKYINIDTRFKDNYETDVLSKQTITLPERYTDVRNISVVNAELPMSYYNISSALGNNSFEITEDDTVEIIIVPDGEYTKATLTIKINELIDTHNEIAIGNHTIITHTDNSHSHNLIKIDFTKDATGSCSRFGFKSSLGWLLGFREPIYTFEGTQLSTYIASGLTSTAIVSLSGPRYLYLVVDEFTSSGNQSSFVSPLPSSLINKNILARISVSKQDYPFGSVMPANLYNGLLMSDVRSYTGKVDIQKLNIQLVNEFGNVIDLNGDDFSFCLKIEHE